MSWNPFDAARSAQSPLQTSPTAGLGSPGGEDDGSANVRKRKRSSVVPDNNGDGDLDNGSVLGRGSVGEGSPGSASRQRHMPGVKRACNDCRQQKLRCNVTAGPGEQYKPCDRCIKHNLKCSIDNDFKRLGKRAAHEEMARELEQCKAKLAEYEALGVTLQSDASSLHPTFNSSNFGTSTAGAAPVAHMASQPFLGPSEAAASRSLLDLSQGYRELPPTSFPSVTPGATPRNLRNVTLSDEQITELYSIYFTSFHPFMPVLNPDWTYNQYYSLHPLLHWTIIAVAARRYDVKPGLLVEIQNPIEEMIWTALSQVPQVYHVCKALALLCTWPFPSASTSAEPTMMLAGCMFQLALQYGLHRPSHAQDFSRFRIDLREEDIADRLNTWATVNIVAQMVSTGQGQPPLSRWAWYTYGLHLDRMKPELHTRCQIEKFCDTVTRTLFTMQRDHIVEVDEAQRGLQIDMYARELNEMELTIMSTRASPIETLYLKAAALHLRLAAFFDKPTQPNYLTDLRNVYIAASSLLTIITEMPSHHLLYVPRYIEQMMLAGAVTLLKILNSFYATHVDLPSGRTLFSRTVSTLRRLSVRSNDLPQRLAEVTAQLWASSGASEQELFNHTTEGSTAKPPDESLQLRVRCRSSLSVLFDAIWRWRQQVGQAGRDQLQEAVEHPTSIVGAGADTASRNTPQPPMGVGAGTLAGLSADKSGTGNLGGLSGDDPLSWDNFGGNAVFDPLSWALDGNLQFGDTFGDSGGLGGLGTFQV